MTGREKIEAAFSPEGTPEVPAVICYEGIFIRDHWDELTSYPWWYAQAPDLERQMRWRRDVVAAIGQDWLRLGLFSRGDDRQVYTREDRAAIAIQERDGRVYRVDRRTGAEAELVRPRVGGWPADGQARSERRRPVPATPEEIDVAVWVPEPADLPRAMGDGRADLVLAMAEEFGHDRYPICHVASPLECMDGLWGFEGMMTMIATEPQLVKHACRRYLDLGVHAVREAAAIGIAGVWIEECLTDMISPAAFAELSLPFVRALIEEIRSLGLHSIYYFCGNPSGKWGLLLDAGADALSLEESKKGFTIDIEAVAERVDGRCALLGNLDAIGVLQPAAGTRAWGGSEAQLRAEIARQIAAGERNRGRFVLSTGSPVTPETPVERVRLYCDLTRELGRL